jgi:spoIIIJ-associated protein
MPEKSDRSVQVSARTVDEATAKALRELSLTRDAVDVEVIRAGSRGLLGLLGEEAVVRVTARAATARPGGAARPTYSIASGDNRADVGTPPAYSVSSPVRHEAGPIADEVEGEKEPEAADRDSDTADDLARKSAEALQGLLDHMGLRARVTQEQPPEEGGIGADAVMLNISGSDMGVLIGRQGETLRDLQFMTALIVSRHSQRWPNLVVDVEHYKARRQQALMDLARRMADRVRASGESVSLEPMPAGERRIVHLALKDDPDVFTESTGFEDKRRVVIMLKG